ncbi:MAG: rhodanese-like domain-containing protein [Saccharofermentanales bacterium]|jgi:phage shock protein E
MKTNKLLSIVLITAVILGFVLPGCNKTTTLSEMPYEAVHLGDNLFVITKTAKEAKENLYMPFVAHFDSPQDIQVSEVMALAFDELMESFPPQAIITASEKLPEKSKFYSVNFSLGNQLLQINPERTYLIDVRSVEEYEEGHVPGSINIPVNQLSEIANIIPDPDSTLLLYCRSGNRTVTAARILLELGYKVIFNLGGLSGYDGDLEK